MARGNILIIVTLLLTACNQSPKSELKISDKLVPASDSQIAIIKYDTALHGMFKNGTPTTLSVKEINAIEEIMEQFVSEYNAKWETYILEKQPKSPDYRLSKEDFLIELRTYGRQYVAIVNINGDKEIWINCFCQIDGTDWKERVIVTKDGGKCHFQLKVNLTTKTFYEVNINGEA